MQSGSVWIQRLRPSRRIICSIAHAACSAINGSGSCVARSRNGKSSSVPTFPKRHADVAQETAALDSPDRRIAKQSAKSCFIQLQEIAQLHLRDRRTRRERDLIRSARKSIPRTGVEAIVATVNAVANERTKFERNRTFQFNREVGNTTARIQTVRFRDRTGRARSDAASAGPATVALRRIGRRVRAW